MLKIQSPVPEIVGYTLYDHVARTITTVIARRGEPPVTVVVPFLSVPEPEPVSGPYL